MMPVVKECLPRATDAAINLMADQLVASQYAAVTDLFSRQQARPPRIVWSPCAGNLRHPLLSQFAHICREHLHTDGKILVEDFQLDRFTPVAPWTMTLDINTPQGEFVFNHFGDAIAESFGADMAGRPISDLAPHISQFYTALYRAACQRKEWFLSEHEPPRQVFVQSWLRLFVPLFNRTGDVAKFVALNYPENALRAGLEVIPDPVFVADNDMVVCFANRAARSAFSLSPRRSGLPMLPDIIGTRLMLPYAPSKMLESGIVENRIVHLRIGNSLEDDFLVTVSAASHAERAFYIVMVRPLTPGL